MKGKIKSVRLESGDSGYEVSCCCEMENNSGGMYDMPNIKSYDYYFSEDDAKGAFEKFKELDEDKKGEE